MNIVYLLTNTSKQSGARFYIGSKTECSIITLDGIPTIISLKDNKPYYSSSQNQTFIEDFKKGDAFVASLLEEVPNRDLLLSVENKHILENKAVESEDYYNLSEAKLAGYMYHVDSPKNKFGETIKSYAQNESNSSKKRNRAKKLGFETYGHLATHIYKEVLSGKSFAEVSRSLNEGKHFAKQFISNWDMDRALQSIETIDKKQVSLKLREYLSKGCSLKKAAELLEIEEPVAEILNNNFSCSNKKFKVALQKGLTNEELEEIIAKDIIDLELGFKECAKKQGMTILNVQRYFLRYTRKRLKSNDL